MELSIEERLKDLYAERGLTVEQFAEQAWCQIEKLYPEVKAWEMAAPYFEQRNIHFWYE